MIEVKGNYEKLHESIPLEVMRSGCRNLGIIADANSNYKNRKKSIINKLNETNDFEILEKDGLSDCIFTSSTNSKLRVGIWLMPDNCSQGELEDLVYNMIPEIDPILPLAKEYIDKIPSEKRKFIGKKTTRAYVYAWLATRKNPNPMGLSIKVGDLSHDSQFANAFVAWFHQLFYQD